MNPVTIAYHSSAATEAQRLVVHLHELGYQTQQTICESLGANLGIRLMEVQGPVFLLINDELLHAQHCQSGLLDAYKQLYERSNVHPVMASSQRRGPGEVQARVLTSLARVSDVIRYMNYWQNAYLIKRRELGQTNTPEAMAEIAPIRRISQEIGEMLRLIRESKPLNVIELTSADATMMAGLIGHPESIISPKSPSSEYLPAEDDVIPPLKVDQESAPESEQKTQEVQPEEFQPNDLAAKSVEEPAYLESVESIPLLPVEAASTSTPATTPEDELAKPEESVQDEAMLLLEPINEGEEDPAGSTKSPETTDSDQPSKTVDETDTTAVAKPQPSLAPLARLALDQSRQTNLATYLDLLNSGDPDSAHDFAQSALDTDPDDNRLRYAHAVGLLEAAEDEESLVDEAAEVIGPLFQTSFAAAAHLCLGQVGLRLRDYGSARRHLLTAYKLNKSLDRELPYKIGALLQDEFEEESDLARRYLKIAVRKSSLHEADANYRLGHLELTAGKARRATSRLKRALALERDHPFAAYDLALAYLQRGREQRAQQLFSLAASVNPELDTESNRQAFGPLDDNSEGKLLPEVGKEKFQRFVSSRDVVAGQASSEESRQLSTGLEELSARDRAGQETHREVLTVLITGASSGIGEATARVFAAEGYRLILAGRRVDRLLELSAELKRQHKSEVRLLSFDLTDRDAAQQMLESLDEQWSNVDVLINNAGKAKGLAPIHEGDWVQWEEMIDTNIKGLLYMTRLVAPGMVARRKGHIINVCSTAGHEVYQNGAVYCATKHAVDALTQGSRLDLFRFNIRVSQVSPAAVEETEFSSVRFDGDQERAAKVYEGFQPLKAEDVAKTILSIATQPPHVNIQDVIMLATQQANSTTIDRSGRNAG